MLVLIAVSLLAGPAGASPLLQPAAVAAPAGTPLTVAARYPFDVLARLRTFRGVVLLPAVIPSSWRVRTASFRDSNYTSKLPNSPAFTSHPRPRWYEVGFVPPAPATRHSVHGGGAIVGEYAGLSACGNHCALFRVDGRVVGFVVGPDGYVYRWRQCGIEYTLQDSSPRNPETEAAVKETIRSMHPLAGRCPAGDREYTLVPNRRIGPVRLGEPAAVLRTQFPLESCVSGAGMLDCTSADLEATAGADGVNLIITTSSQFRTVAGIRIGSPVAALLHTYPHLHRSDIGLRPYVLGPICPAAGRVTTSFHTAGRLQWKRVDEIEIEIEKHSRGGCR